METEDAAGGAAGAHAAYRGFRWHLFAVLWATAALFHLAGNRRPDWIAVDIGFIAVHLGIAAAAVAVLVGWQRRAALLFLCGLVVVSAFLEMPVVGNHWVLAGLVSLAYLIAAAGGARGRGGQPAQTWARFAPAARLSFLIAYGFAAFAKLNSDFFDPSVSCAVYYHDQLVRSWGLGALTSAGRPGLGLLMAVAAAAVELSVAGLLAFRRTRRLGLLLALPFHWMLAMDFSQHFWDFSSVLFAGFLLFADDAVVDGVRARLQRFQNAVRPSVRKAAAAIAGVIVVAVAVGTVTTDSAVSRGFAVLGAHIAWAVVGTAIVVVVVLAVLRARTGEARAGDTRGMVRATGLVAIVPLLVFVNGLTPYLEIKTGFGWNMYSNLRTVAGESNHFLVSSTLDVTGLQADRVAIVQSSDPDLAALADRNFEVVYSEFREYAHDYPDESVTYRRGLETIEATRIGDDEAGKGGVSWVSKKLQSFRVVDTADAVRCQSVFGPAR